MKELIIGSILFALQIAVWVWSFFFVTTEVTQGDVYRIMYVHVPCAFSAFFASILLFFFSLGSLKNPNSHTHLLAKGAAEVGCLFTVLTLVTGSIWGRPTWGTWWTWDARLTTTLILALLYTSYLLLFAAMPHGTLRSKVCAIFGLLICADIPLIYKSVTWWRTLHQPPSLMTQNGNSAMSAEIYQQLCLAIVVTIGLSVWLIFYRFKNMKLKEELLHLSFEGNRL